MKEVVIYTDGACSGNPGPGGWGAVLLAGPHRKELSGYEEQTTNQRMELKAIIEALRALKVSGWDITVYTDSAYVVNAFEQRWIDNWLKNGWQNSRKEPVANRDLWMELLQAMEKNRVHIKRVKGHAGHPLNERCDELARTQIKVHVQNSDGKV